MAHPGRCSTPPAAHDASDRINAENFSENQENLRTGRGSVRAKNRPRVVPAPPCPALGRPSTGAFFLPLAAFLSLATEAATDDSQRVEGTRLGAIVIQQQLEQQLHSTTQIPPLFAVHSHIFSTGSHQHEQRDSPRRRGRGRSVGVVGRGGFFHTRLGCQPGVGSLFAPPARPVQHQQRRGQRFPEGRKTQRRRRHRRRRRRPGQRRSRPVVGSGVCSAACLVRRTHKHRPTGGWCHILPTGVVHGVTLTVQTATVYSLILFSCCEQADPRFVRRFPGVVSLPSLMIK